MARILLTVPHAVCRSEEDKSKHFCDIVAEGAARKLFDYLTDKGHKVMLRVGDVSRIENDLNRPESRDTDFRKRILTDFKRADFLLDVHSYPQEHVSWNSDFVLLKWNKGGQDNRELVADMVGAMARADLDVATANAEQVDDVVAHALENNLPAMLVEFSEKAFEKRKKEILEKFAATLSDFLNAKKEPEQSVQTENLKLENLLARMTESVGSAGSSFKALREANHHEDSLKLSGEVWISPTGEVTDARVNRHVDVAMDLLFGKSTVAREWANGNSHIDNVPEAEQAKYKKFIDAIMSKERGAAGYADQFGSYTYLLKNGWVRYYDDSFTVYELTDSKMKLIADYLMAEQGRGESDDETVYITDEKARRDYHTTVGAIISEPSVAGGVRGMIHAGFHERRTAWLLGNLLRG